MLAENFPKVWPQTPRDGCYADPVIRPSRLPGATKGNTLQAARARLCIGVGKTTGHRCGLAVVTRSGCRDLARRRKSPGRPGIFCHSGAAPAAGGLCTICIGRSRTATPATQDHTPGLRRGEGRLRPLADQPSLELSHCRHLRHQEARRSAPSPRPSRSGRWLGAVLRVAEHGHRVGLPGPGVTGEPRATGCRVPQ